MAEGSSLSQDDVLTRLSTEIASQKARNGEEDADQRVYLAWAASEEIQRLRELLWRIQPILNAGSEIAFAVEKVVGSVHTNRDAYTR